jgi:4-hydroxyphenylpyruvate dioxygenase-like putative hemolysin
MMATSVQSRVIKMQVNALDHVQLAMPAGGEGLARRFYTDILGIPEVEKPSNTKIH